MNEIIYYISNGKNIKIGFSKNPNNRVRQLQTASDEKLTILAIENGDKKKESERHFLFKNEHINGEWYSPSENLLYHINTISQYYIECQDGKIIKYMKMKI